MKLINKIRIWFKKGIWQIETFYHGTSTNIKIDGFILPPVITYNQREDFRKKHADKVFSTDSIKSAKMYAKKACEKYGGKPIVYIGNIIYDINHECMSDKALIIKVLNKK